MNVYENGSYREMTAEELSIMEHESSNAPVPMPTAEERISALEAAMLYILDGGI